MKFSISSIEMTNFRQYSGKQTLDFLDDKSKNVIIILGKNGSGKSNILNALTWCLYGTEVHKEKDTKTSDSMPIVNTKVLGELGENERTFAEVCVYLKVGRDTWTIKRRIEGGKNNDGSLFFEQSKLTVVHPIGGQDKIDTGEGTQLLINNLLPDALKNSFFIDGEQLREFFRISTPEKISKAIDTVSQLDLVYNSIKHLTQYEKVLRKNIKDVTPQLKEIQNRIQFIQDEDETRTAQIKIKREEKEKNEKDLIEVKEFLKTHNSSVIAALERERQLLEDAVKSFQALINKRQQERNSYLVDIAPFIYLKKELKQTYDFIEEKVEKGELPPRIKETFVKELLEKGICICGNKLEGEAKKELEEYSKKLSLSELSEISIIGKTTIDDIFNDIDQFPEKIDQFNAEIDDLKWELEKKERRIEEISSQIKDVQIDEIKRYENRREELIGLIEKSKQIIKLLDAELKTSADELEKLRKREESELSKDRKYASYKEKLALVKDALKVLQDTEVIIKNKIRNQVEEYTEKNFLTLIRKKSAFKDVSINENYEVRVEHAHGYNVINDLSAGEYLILGLSFMSSLMTISGFHAPVIIDTPLAKIDDEHREYITTELPKFLEGTQLILLVTPTEYDQRVKANIEKFIVPGNFFEIKEDETKTESMVVRYGV